MKRLSESDLLAIRSGHTEPLKNIYRAHYESCVRQMQLKMNSSKEDAEDLMMDTLLILRDNIMNDLFKNENVGAYLLTVGINKWRNKIKRDRRLDEYDPSLIGQKIVAEESERNPKVIVIFKAMTEIKGNCNRLLHRNLIDGIPLQTLVAELEYKSYDVIKTTKSRCLKKLRTIVNEILSTNG